MTAPADPVPADPAAACVSRLKLLADPTRLKVIEMLSGAPLLVHEIQTKLDIEQNLLSHHLKVLREGGLVEAERQGKAVRYRLAPGVQAGGAAGAPAIDLGCCRLSFD